MLADQLDYVIGVDPHRDLHALAVVQVRTGGVVFEGRVAASTSGYRTHSSSRRSTLQGGARSRSKAAAPSEPA